MRAELAAGKLSFFLCGEKLKGSYALVRTAEPQAVAAHQAQGPFRAARTTCSRATVPCSAARASRRWHALKVTQRLRGRAPGAQRACGEHAAADSSRCWPRSVMLRSRIRSGATSRSSTAIASSPSSTAASVRLQSRRGLDLTAVLPGTRRRILRTQPVGGMILDGEIVALDAVGPALVQRAAEPRAAQDARGDRRRAARHRPVVLVCFDLLHFAGLNLRGAPYSDRRRYLSQCLLPAPHLQLVHASDNARAAVRRRARARLRGHRRQAARQRRISRGQRSRAWLKIKADAVRGVRDRRLHARQGRARARSVRCCSATGEGKTLRYAGHVGSGLDDESHRRSCSSAPRSSSASARRSPQTPPLHRPTTWLKPEAGRRSDLQRVDSGRLAARAGVPARCATTSTPAACVRSGGRADPATAPRASGARRAPRAAPPRRRGGRGPRAARESGQEPGSEGRPARASSSPTSIASTGRRTRSGGSRRSPSAT